VGAVVNGLIVVHGDRGAVADGIRDHTRMMVRELSRRPLSADELSLPTVPGPGGRAQASLRRWRRLSALRRSSMIVLQYSPFCFGRRGFAPWLPAFMLSLRMRTERPMVALIVHEPFVPMVGWRWVLMGIWQRFQLAMLRLAADVVFASIEPWAVALEAQLPRGPVHHLPVGSNFPDARAARAEERRRLGVGDETLVVACLGRDHPSFLAHYAAAAVNAMSTGGRRLLVLNLGAEAPPLPGLDPGVPVAVPGYLGPDEFAARLAASDLFLAPLIDGVSTRRGSVMAALQHGLPVVGTSGPLTDPILGDAGPALRLIDVGDDAGFAEAAAELAADPEQRRSAGGAARRLYERNFDWPVTADRLLAAIPERRCR
jgi:glycosyltransferase involved in cell wall biosynthesis